MGDEAIINVPNAQTPSDFMTTSNAKAKTLGAINFAKMKAQIN